MIKPEKKNFSLIIDRQSCDRKGFFTPTKELTPSRDLASRLLSRPDVEGRYQNYLLKFKNSHHKNFYHSLIDQRLSKVKEYNQTIQKEIETKVINQNLKINQQKIQEKIIELEKERLEQEKIKTQQEKIEKELKRKKAVKETNINDWIKANYKIFEENKSKVVQEILESKEKQKSINEVNKKINEERYQDIKASIALNREINNTILLLNIKREFFLKSMKARDEIEELSQLPEILPSQAIKEMLSVSNTLDEIKSYFEKDEEVYETI